MSRRSTWSVAVATVLVAVLALPSAGHAAPTVSTASLGDVLSPTYSGRFAVNAAGQVLFHTRSGSVVRAVLWRGGARTPLPTLGGLSTRAEGLNEAGDVVGSLATPEQYIVAVRWTAGGTRAEYVSSPGHPRGHGSYINSSGQIASAQFTGDILSREIVVTGATGPTVLSAPSGADVATTGALRGFNRAGTALVQIDSGRSYYLATTGGQVLRLPEGYEVENAGGRVLNDLFQVLVRRPGTPGPLVWSPFGSQVLAFLPGQPSAAGNVTFAKDLSATGDVAGSTCFGACALTGTFHAVRWRGGAPTDINPFDAHASSAELVNDRGTVVGTYTDAGGRSGAFAWRAGTTVDLGPGTPAALSENDRVVLVDGDTQTVPARLVSISGL